MVCKCNISCCKCCFECEGCVLSQKWWCCFLATLAIIAAFAFRVSTHLTIVRMVLNTTYSKCFGPRSIGTTPIIKDDRNDWSELVQGYIIAIFYVGYTIFYLPSDILVQRYGPGWILSTSISINALCAGLMPVLVDKFGYVAMLCLRFLQGVGQAVLFPAIREYLKRRITADDQQIASAMIFSGAPIGSTAGIMVSGFVMYLFNSWQTVYYFWACFGCVVYLLLIIYFYSDPNAHVHITENEIRGTQESTESETQSMVPYKRILKDGAVIATIISEIGHVTILFFFINDFPKFMDKVLQYPLIDNSVVSSVPYLAPLLTSIIAGKLSDWGIGQKYWDIGYTRKCYVVVSTAFASCFLLGVGYMLCKDYLVIMFLVFAMLLLGFHCPGLKVNAIDLTIQHTAFVSALPHGISGIIGIIQPLICSYMSPNHSRHEWIIIFWIFWTIAVLSTIIFFATGSGKRRRWDYPRRDQKYFKTKVPCFSLFDDADKDREAVLLGHAQEEYEEKLRRELLQKAQKSIP